MQPSGTITLKQGVSKTGNPYTGLQLKVGKWTALKFPTEFEREYLVEYLKDKQGTITIDESNEVLKLQAGDYIAEYKVDSVLEYKYIVDFFRVQKEQAQPHNPDDAKLDLTKEDEIKENPFN